MESVGAPLYTCPVELLESGPCAEAGTENRLGKPGVLMKCGSRTSPLCDKVETLLEGISAGRDGTDSIVPEPVTSALNDTLCRFPRVFEMIDMTLHMDVDQDGTTIYIRFAPASNKLPDSPPPLSDLSGGRGVKRVQRSIPRPRRL